MNEHEKVLLISGTGGAYTIRGKDLENSLFDKNIKDDLINSHYIRNGVRIIPENAFFKDDEGNITPLLRRNQSGYPPLVTRTLEFA